MLQGAQEKCSENTSSKTERKKIQKHLLISMGAFAFAKVVWAIFFMLFESNTLVTLLLHLTTKTGLIVETFSTFLDVCPKSLKFTLSGGGTIITSNCKRTKDWEGTA